MADYVTLMGAEQVQSAARTISAAADTMRSAASEMDSALDRHHRFMDDWLQRFQGVLEAFNTPQVAINPAPSSPPGTKVFCDLPPGSCVLEKGHDGPCDLIPF